MNTKHYIYLFCGVLLMIICSCEDYLERPPLSSITPESYLQEESQLAAYAIKQYDAFRDFGYFHRDNDTDIETGRGYSTRYVPGRFQVAQDGGDWSFTNIYQCNYFFSRVLPMWKYGEIAGSEENVNHYIGEMYFIRAYNYYNKLVALGDFPIVKTVPKDDKEELIALSKRDPRTEVARFIISDLDSAIMLMSPTSPDGEKNRLSKPVAQLLKSRVALFEGTWLKYFKGTGFVPNGPGWPGKDKAYNSSYSFPSGSIDGEIDYFLTQAMEAAKAVAEAIPLTPNSMAVEEDMTFQEYAEAADANPYLKMYSDVNPGVFDEVLMWKAYDVGLGLESRNVIRVQEGGDVGYTRGYVDGCLMSNGLPIYAEGSGYQGDDYLSDVRKGRDSRIRLFLAEPGQINILYPSPLATHGSAVAIVPDIMDLLGNHNQPTGYHHTKGNNYDGVHYANTLGNSVGSIVFRAAEAYLTYIEACYEKNGSLDGSASDYWKQIRARAGVDTDFDKTIAATVLSEEAKNDWGAFSAGEYVDATLFNIRRERRCELLGEGFRFADLKRWRAMDQMMETPYHIEGFKLWGPMQEWYDADKLTYGIGNASTVSDPALSPYLRIHQKTETSLAYNGYRWAMAHYLNPIAVQHFLITSEDNDVSTSPIYQNPSWPIEAASGPIGY